MLLNEYKLSIPSISMEDWRQAVDSATGLPRDILTTKFSGVQLLRRINEPMATTERIGWLNLWAKTFASLEAVAAAITRNSKLVLLLCQRTTFEVMLQIHTILDPFRNLSQKESRQKANEYALRNCIDRFRAYSAWCLWHDKAFYEELLNPRSMRDIWDFDYYRSMQHSEELSSGIEKFLANLPIPLDEAAMQQGSRNMRNFYTAKIRQIDEWLADPRLRRWSSAIEQASRNNSVGIPFFVLFDRSEASIPKRLLKEGLRFCYSTYIMSSMASHGSSMHEFIDIKDDSIKPVLTSDPKQAESLGTDILFKCRHIFDLLEIIHLEMMKNPQIRQ